MIFTQVCDLIHRAPAAVANATGEKPLEQTSTSLGVTCELQQGTTSEALVDRTTQVGEWRLFLPPEPELGQWDQVAARGRTFEVVGLPEMILHPWAGGAPDHQEARLRVVVG